MRVSPVASILTGLYLLVVGIVFAMETYTRIYDRGNSEMTGMVTYIFTMPSSLLIDWASKFVGIAVIGQSDSSFIGVLGLSWLLNAGLIFLATSVLLSLTKSK